MMNLQKSLIDLQSAGLFVARVVAPDRWVKELLRDIPEVVSASDERLPITTVLGITVVTNPWLKNHLVLLDSMGGIVGVVELSNVEQEESKGSGGA